MPRKRSRKGSDWESPARGKFALIRDPQRFADTVPVREDGKWVRILGLDLASSCGAAFCDVPRESRDAEAVIIGGQWDLSLSTHDTQSLRYIRLQQFLTAAAPSLICYEEVKFTGQSVPLGMRRNLQALVARAVSGAQVVQGLAAVLVTWAETRNIPCAAIPVGTLKRFATGRGNANKAMMIEACNERFGTQLEVADYEKTGTDNVADAMFLCALGLTDYLDGLLG